MKTFVWNYLITNDYAGVATKVACFGDIDSLIYRDQAGLIEINHLSARL